MPWLLRLIDRITGHAPMPYPKRPDWYGKKAEGGPPLHPERLAVHMNNIGAGSLSQ